ncbi:CTP pyrophosphohydrolase [Jannaschia seosinensis]|uniref:CTP pyrophosphohydrolase n=1 Tax=Jannaschia seosinensis TaxID=313367 RepID=A0A0M7BH48_9RHOB|nr:NUDIX domain-containing protein [Jannaschia seosinensis]CUH40715.1 CTP pyrophosphohydrolase [Jannaschia seosinensis]
MIRRFGHPPDPAVPWRRRPGAYAILTRGPRLLLTVQETDEGPDVQLPGGGIDPGEAALPALLREIREETGHTAQIIRHLGAFRDYRWMPEYRMHAEKVCHIYQGRVGLRVGPPSEPHHTVMWCSPDEALDRLASAGGRHILERWMRARGRSGGRSLR